MSIDERQPPAGDDLDIDLRRVWVGVAAETMADRSGAVERLLGGLLRSPGLARAIVTAPSLVASWIIASAIVLGVGVVATAGSQEPWFALGAPVLAGIGVAYAYGPGIDAAFELSQTMAISDRSVLLGRVLAVFGLNALTGIVASLVTASAVGLTLGWLLPMTTVAAIALAASTMSRSANVGVGAALASWTIIVLATAYDAGSWVGAVRPDAASSIAVFYLITTGVCSGLALVATSGRWSYRTGGERWQ